MQFFQQLVHTVVHQQTLVDTDELAGFPVHVAQCALPVDGESGVVAVSVFVGRGFYFGDGWVSKVANALQGVGHLLTFGLQLGIVGEVLPLAAGALIVVGAGRLNPVWRRLKHDHHLGGDVLAVDFYHLPNHFLSGDTTGHEHVMSVKFGHSLTQPSPRCKRKGYSVSLLCDALGYLHKLVNTIIQGG